jgi:DNA-binding transcriptional LysR family regulator
MHNIVALNAMYGRPPMEALDLNLLVALDVLLTEESVTGAARRLGLSASAMSRTLARLRTATGDPLLVRAGRGLVPTPRAADLRDRVHGLVQDARKVFTPPAADIDPATLDRTFVVRAGEGFVALCAAPVVTAVTRTAPHVRLRFVPKPAKESAPLREGQIDLEIGTPGIEAPEIRTRLLFRDRFVGAVRLGHPLLAGQLTAERYAACDHVVVSKKDNVHGPVDHALRALGLERRIVAAVPGFPDAMRIARDSDLVALVPWSCVSSNLATTKPLVAGLTALNLPVDTPEISVFVMWHPRMDADPAHRWLREMISHTCRTSLSSEPSSGP